METLSRALRDAADDAPTTLDVSAEEWVSTSWRSGRRRRAVRGVAAGAGLADAAALVVSLVVSGVGGMPSASVPADGSSRSSREAVTSYPQRIGHQWCVRDLPTAPGPIAAVVQTYSEDDDAPRPGRSSPRAGPGTGCPAAGTPGMPSRWSRTTAPALHGSPRTAFASRTW